MTLTQPRYIIVIPESDSLNKAAELLYIPQPPLTNSLKELEDKLGGWNLPYVPASSVRS